MLTLQLESRRARARVGPQGLLSLLQKLGGGPAYYWQIMLPGSVLGMIVGYATFRHQER